MMLNPPSRLLWVTGLLLLAGAPGCGRRVEPAPIRIGVLVNLAGSEGTSTEQAAALALEAIDTAGGLEVGGRRQPVKLLFEDTRTSPEGAIAGVRRLVQRGVVAIVGPSRSRDAIAAAGLAENSKIPMISAASTHPETTDGKRYVFRVTFTDTFQGVALARFASEDLAASTAAVLYDIASTYNRDLATVFQRTFEAAGGKMVAIETYVTGDSDFRRQLERIGDAGPEILLLPNYDEEIPLQVRQARQMGIEATFLGGDSWTQVKLGELPELEGTFFSQHWHLDAAESHPQARQFIAAFRRAFGDDPNNDAALTYDAFGLLFHALESAGKDPDQIQQALAGIEGYRGVTGTITYRGTQGDPRRPISIVQVGRGETVLYREIEP